MKRHRKRIPINKVDKVEVMKDVVTKDQRATIPFLVKEDLNVMPDYSAIDNATISDSEYSEIVHSLDWYLYNEKCFFIENLLFGSVTTIRSVKRKFFSKWDLNNENLAVFRFLAEEWLERKRLCIKWNDIEGQKLLYLRTLFEMKIDPNNYFFVEWGYTEENAKLVQSEKQVYNEAEDGHKGGFKNRDSGGFDDGYIIRRIQDGDGDMYGY